MRSALLLSLLLPAAASAAELELGAHLGLGGGLETWTSSGRDGDHHPTLEAGADLLVHLPHVRFGVLATAAGEPFASTQLGLALLAGPSFAIDESTLYAVGVAGAKWSLSRGGLFEHLEPVSVLLPTAGIRAGFDHRLSPALRIGMFAAFDGELEHRAVGVRGRRCLFGCVAFEEERVVGGWRALVGARIAFDLSAGS